MREVSRWGCAVTLGLSLWLLPQAAWGAPNTTTITLWTYGSLVFPKDVLDAFESQTHIHVNVEVHPWSDRSTGLSLAMASGSAPDISYLNNDFVPIFEAKGALEPLDSHMSSSFLASYPKSYVDTLRIDGHIWEWPMFEEPYDDLINADMFRAVGLDPGHPPAKWDDIAAAGQKLVMIDAAGRQTRSGIQLLGSAASTQMGWQQVMWQFGGELLTPDLRKVAFDSKAAVDSLSFIVDLRKRGVAAPLSWTNGQTGMLMFTGEAPSGISFAWKWGAVPQGTRRITVGASDGYVIWAGSQHKAQAVAFLRYITQSDVQRKILAKWGFVSIRRTIRPEGYGKDAASVKELIQQVSPYFQLRGWNYEREINQTYLSPYVWKAWQGELTPSAALESAATEANAFLVKQHADGAPSQ